MRLRVDNIPVTFTANTSTSEPVSVGNYEHAAIHIGSTWVSCTLGLSASPTKTGTYVTVVDNSQVAVKMLANPSSAIVIPAEYVGALRWVRFVGSADQTTATTVHVSRKG